MGSRAKHKPAWLDQLEPDAVIALPPINCSDEAVASYARLFNANHPLHVDDDYARNSRFGQRITHGPFLMAASLAPVGDYFGDALIAMLEVENWTFLGPVPVGATVAARFKIAELHPHAHKPLGRVVVEIDILGQDDTLLQQGSASMLVARKPGRAP